MIQPCQTVNPCASEPLPLLGYDASAPDVLNHIGLAWATIPPPLNFPFRNVSSFVALDVPVSNPGNQEVANLMAQAQARQSAADGWTTPDGQPVQTFQSSTQFVTETCPDGSTFTFGVVAGLFVDLTQAGADQAALSYCQRQVQLHVVCLGGTFPALCLNQFGSVTITASGVSLGKINENVWAITIGELPPGMVLNGGAIASDSVTITGIPTSPGVYPFTVMVTTPQGDYMEKAFSITVVGVTNGALPPTTAFVPYSLQLEWFGFNAPVFTLDASSTLPAGLSLSASGLISGTPTVAGDYSFIVDVTDAVADCQQLVELTVSAFPVYTITPDMAGDVSYFNGGAVFPFGTYVVTYIDGAVDFRGHWGLNLFLGGGSTELQYYLTGTVPLTPFPGTTTDLGSQAAVESANQGQSYTFKATGQFGMYLTHFPIIAPVAGSPAPTFSLTRIA